MNVWKNEQVFLGTTRKSAHAEICAGVIDEDLLRLLAHIITQICFVQGEECAVGYEEWWKALESLIAEFRRKGVKISSDTMTYLRSAKTMINICKADPSCLEPIITIEGYLLDVESTLMNMAKERFGKDYMERWIKKLEKARREEEAEARSKQPRFVAGHPRGEHWIRIHPSDNMLRDNIEKLANETRLSWKAQKDGYILVHGSEERIKEFVRKMAEICRRTRKS